MNAIPQKTIRGYQIHEQIGMGGYGVVHLGYQPVVEREIAIKIIQPRFANEPSFIYDFETEAQLIARLEHPYIVPIYDYWRDPSGAYLAMRYLRGGSLGALLAKEGRIAPERVLTIFDQIITALYMAHQAGVVHMDLKPDNILLDQDGNAYLTDFGIAKAIGQNPNSDGFSGTLAYSSPEYLRDLAPATSMDIYSLGIMLFELVTGERPFKGDTLQKIVKEHIYAVPPNINSINPDLPPRLNEVILKATAKNPADRYPDVRGLLRDLRQAINGSTAVMDTSPAIELPIFNPYKGLRAFQESDAPNFFGRESLIRSLIQRIHDGDRFIAIVGPSGSGKSSVMRAGLVPRLRTETIGAAGGWFSVDMHPGENPLQALTNALMKISPIDLPDLYEQMQEDPQALSKACNIILQSIGDQIILVIDQFEEVFTQVTDEAIRKQFLDLLYTTVQEQATSVRIVIALRADFYHRPLMYEGFGTLIEQHTQTVLPLNAEELERAIVGPANRVGIEIEGKLLAAIVADVRQEPGALPLLQYTLTELFDQQQGRILTYRVYEEYGGVLGALAQRAETIFAELTQDEQDLTRQIFLRLVTPGEGSEDTRHSVRRAELYETIGNRVTLDRMLQHFGEARLLTFDIEGRNREPMIEIAHEALIAEWARLSQWLDESRQDRRLHRQLNTFMQEWDEHHQHPNFLLTGGHLVQFQDWAKKQPDIALLALERTYLEHSIHKHEEEQKEEEIRRLRELDLKQQAINRLRYLMIAVFFIAILGVTLSALSFVGFRSASSAEATAVSNQERAVAAEATAIRRAEEADARLLSSQLDQIALSQPELAYGLGITMLEEIENLPRSVENSIIELLLTRRVIQRFLGHEGPISHVIFSDDDQTALSVSEDATIRRWDVKTGEQLQVYSEHDDWVRTVIWRAGNTQMLSASSDTTIKLWDVESADVLRTYEGHEDVVSSLALFSDEERVVSGSFDHTAIIWDLESGEIIHHLEGHEDWVWDVKISPDDTLIATSSTDTTIIIWDAETGEQLHHLVGHDDDVSSIAFFPDSKTFLSGGHDGIVILWDAETGEQIQTLPRETAGVWRVQISPDGKYFMTATEHGVVVLWDSSLFTPIGYLNGHAQGATDAIFSSDNRYGLTGSEDNSLILWDLESIYEKIAIRAHDFVTSGLAIAPDGKSVISISWDKTIANWDLETDELIYRVEGHEGWITSVAYSPDGTQLLTGDFDGGLILWDAKAGEMIERLPGHENRIEDTAFSVDGRYGATASLDGTAIIWDLETYEAKHILPVEGLEAYSVAFSPDQTQVLVGVNDGRILRWDLESEEVIAEFIGHGAAPMDIEYAPDGQSILSGAQDSRLILWDAESGIELRSFVGHERLIEAVSFASDGKTALSSSADETIRYWDLESGELLRTLHGVGWASGVDHLPGDDSRALSISGNGIIFRWRVSVPHEELVDWAYANRDVHMPDCAERVIYRTPHLCDTSEDAP